MAFCIPRRSDFGLISGSDREDQDRQDELCNSYLSDDDIVVMDGNGYHNPTSTGTDVQGTFTVCAIVHRIPSTHFHLAKDKQIQPKGGDTAQYKIALMTALLLSSQYGPSPFAHHQLRASPPSELMKYHPIDRGRCCHFIATCTHSFIVMFFLGPNVELFFLHSVMIG